MPEAFAPTMAEREAELLALQSAFDEYIASSRELEEELDAELGKMQEKLTESAQANSALSSQLENIGPQLNSLESSLTDSRHKLKEEQKLRRAAEQAQDDAEQRLREMDQSLQHLRDECDAVHEELAFKESELEETRLELEVDKQQLQNELMAAKSALDRAENYKESVDEVKNTAADEDTDRATIVSKVDTTDSVPSVDDAYVKKLEEELELVTEQLIETEKRLGDTEAQLENMSLTVEQLENQGRNDEDSDLIRTLQSENADLLDGEQKIRDELELTKEELMLAKEEIQLQQDELQASEEEAKMTKLTLEEEGMLHRDEITKLQIAMKESELASKASLEEAAMVATRLAAANEENAELEDQLAGMEQALKNARDDYQSVLDELDAVNVRFDEAREEAKQEGREAATEELRKEMQTDNEHDIRELKDQLSKLRQENSVLQQRVDDTEVRLAAYSDSQNGHLAANLNQTEVVNQLQTQLARAKEELTKKEKEMTILSVSLEERLIGAEQQVTHLENELHGAKGQLAESEARLIVLKRDRDTKDYCIPPASPKRVQKILDQESNTSHTTPLSRGRSFDREELSNMDPEPSPPHLTSPGSAERARSASPSSVMRLELRLSEETQKLNNLQKDFNSLQDQKRIGEVRIKRLEEDLKTLQKEMFASGNNPAAVTQMSRLSSLASKDKHIDFIADEDTSSRVQRIVEQRDVKAMAEELTALQKKCNGQREYNAQLLSKMLHLQGNIQVYCRVRPLTYGELDKSNKVVVEALSETEVGCFDGRSNKWKSFAFDRVWGPDQSQQSVFQDVEPLALSVVDGFNACIFAYGQTGSGKTWTMTGSIDNSQYGISYRTIQKIFHLLKLRAQQQRAAELFVGAENEDEPAQEVGFHFSLEVGMLEIYNDEIYDLLASEGSSREEKKRQAMDAGGKTSLEIRRSKDGRVEVPDLTKEPVNSIMEVMELLGRGNLNRATATTDMNEHSSRSHMVLSVDVYSGLDEAQRNKGTLYLVDLAGCERVRKSHVDGEQLKEAGFINKSLSALGNVMEALDRKAAHVPYRDSKLTYLLQDSLGGNSRSMMVVTINPIDDSYDESVNALQFATRVRRIQIGAAQRNVTSKNLEETVKSLTEEMRSLTRAKERTEGQLHTLKRDNTRVQEKLSNLSKSKAQSRTDSKTLDVLKKNNDDMAERWKKEKAAREEQSEELENTRKELRTVQQELGKQKSKMTAVERALQEKDHELELATKQLRQERSDKAATNIRARRDQVLSGRKRQPDKLSLPSSNGSAGKSGASEDAVADGDDDGDVADIRAKVLALLEKYDMGKVNRIDIIMDKFKGKESLLLDKMTQRYEAGSASPAVSAQKRNEMALERHKRRMEKIREQKAKNGS